MNAFVITELYYNFTKNEINIGGVETYVADVIRLLIDAGISPTILQKGNEEKKIDLQGYTVKQLIAINIKELVEVAAKDIIDSKKDLVIFGTDTLLYDKVNLKKTIAIQHGIWWDKPYEGPKGRLQNYFPCLSKDFFLKRAITNKSKNAFNIINRLRYIKKVVCVDYNFNNWYRSLVETERQDLVVIPNYTRICSPIVKPNGIVNIIFARRLVPYRGTRVFVSAIKRILKDYSGINVTVAGTGPDEQWMHEQLGAFSNVNFLQYKPEESMKIHADKHIAIVPTIGSEGTSLSLLEAMSAQCATICTDVGGMTNIVLDGFNGKMIKAGVVEDLYLVIKFLLDNPSETKRLALNGYETVKYSFSYERWAERWHQVISEALTW